MYRDKKANEEIRIKEQAHDNEDMGCSGGLSTVQVARWRS